MHMLGAASDLDVAFRETGDQDAERNSMEGIYEVGEDDR